MLSASSNSQSFLLTSLVAATRARITRAPAYGGVCSSLTIPSSIAVPNYRGAAAVDAALTASARSRANFSGRVASVHVNSARGGKLIVPQSRRRWARAGMRQTVTPNVAGAPPASFTSRWGRRIFFSSVAAGAGCVFAIAAAGGRDANVASFAPTASRYERAAIDAATEAARATAHLSGAVLAAFFTCAVQISQAVGIHNFPLRTATKSCDGGDGPSMWWLAGAHDEVEGATSWVNSIHDHGSNLAARMERFASWCIGRRHAAPTYADSHQDAIPLLAMFTAPLFMLLYALLCCF